MKMIKSISAALLVTAMLAGPAMAQQEKKTHLKEHRCTAACTKEKHAYAHGEKGHVCTDACKKADKKGNS
ncbi:MAG: hypothetical protein NVS3B15_17670 [Sediminibacterium sp.]